MNVMTDMENTMEGQQYFFWQVQILYSCYKSKTW